MLMSTSRFCSDAADSFLPAVADTVSHLAPKHMFEPLSSAAAGTRK
jgi:hypothetical protein